MKVAEMLLEPHSEASAEAQEITLWGPRQLCTLPGGDGSGMNLKNLKELEDEEEA